MTIYLSSLIPK